MPKIGDLLVSLTADVAQFNSGMQSAAASLNRVEAEVSSAREAITALAEVFGSITSFAAIEAATKSAIAFGAQIVETSQRLGISGTAFQEYSFIVQQAGGDVDLFSKSLTMLERNVGNAEAGLLSAKKNFDTWGIAIEDVSGKVLPLDAILANITTRLGELQSPAQRIALLQDTMGKGAGALAGALSQGTDEINRQKQAAIDLGVVLDDQSANTLKKFEDEIRVISQELKVEFAGSVASAIDWIKSLREEMGATQSVDSLKADLADIQAQIAEVQKINKDPSILGPAGVSIWDTLLGQNPEQKKQELANLFSQAELVRQQITAAEAAAAAVKPLPTPTGTDTVQSPQSPQGSSAADKAQQALQQRLADTTAKLKEQTDAQNALAEAYVQGDAAVDQMKAQQQALSVVEEFGNKLTADQKAGLYDAALAWADAKENEEAAKKAVQDYNAETAKLDAAAKSIISATDPIAKLKDEFQQLDELVASGRLTFEQYGQAVQKYAADAQKAIDGTDSSVKDNSQALVDFADQVKSQFVDAITQGKSLTDVVTALSSYLLQTILEIEAFGPIEDALRNYAKSGTGFSLSSIVGDVLSGAEGLLGLGNPAPKAGPAFAQGGVIDTPGTYMGGEGGPEAVLPLARGPGGALGVAALGDGGVQAPIVHVEVNNYSPDKATVDQSTGPGGSPKLRVMVGKMISEDIRKGGASAVAMQDVFGLGRQTLGR